MWTHNDLLCHSQHRTNQDPKFLGIVLGNYIAHNLDNNNFVQGVANDRPSLPFYGIMTEMANEAAQAMHRLRTDPILEGRRLSKCALLRRRVCLCDFLHAKLISNPLSLFILLTFQPSTAPSSPCRA